MCYYLYNFSNDGLARVKKDFKKKRKELKEWAFIDKTGKEAISNLKFLWLWDFKEGMARFVTRTGWGFIDKSGEEVIKIENCDWIDDFYDGLARVKFSNGSMGFLNKSGVIVYST